MKSLAEDLVELAIGEIDLLDLEVGLADRLALHQKLAFRVHEDDLDRASCPEPDRPRSCRPGRAWR